MGWKKREQVDGVPVASFSDIAFLLIIYFILATSLNKTAGFRADIPKSEKDSQPSENKETIVTVTDKGFLLDSSELSLDQLREKLKNMELGKDPANPRFIILEHKGGVSYEPYYQCWAAIRAAGGFVALYEEEKGSR